MAMKRNNYSPQLGAIQIISSRVSDDGKKVIVTVDDQEDGVPNLKEILCSHDIKDLPLLVYSVTGKTRGGKSFLLNLMNKFLKAEGKQNWKENTIETIFDWKTGRDSITRGLWMCPKIYKRVNSEGKQVGIVLLDNEGLFDGEQTEGEATAISGVSTSLSHWQMFNLKESITSENLEGIHRFLVQGLGESSEDEEEFNKINKLMFIVRDFIGAEDMGCGLDNGRKYIKEELQRGTDAHRCMWKGLHKVFGDMECLLLPEPGSIVKKHDFEKKPTLSVVEPEFVLEIDKFFRWLFAPANLVPHNPSVTGQYMYNCLTRVHGRTADDSLSFINMYMEAGNDDKLDKLMREFERCASSISTAHSLISYYLNTAQKKFKGDSANEYFSKFKKNMEDKINRMVKSDVLKQYEKDLSCNIPQNHNQTWPSVERTLKSVCGPDKTAVTQDIVKECAVIYYSKLQKNLSANFRAYCKNKTLKELAGLDHAYVKNEFNQCFDFTNAGCSRTLLNRIWQKEQQKLKEVVQYQLLLTVSELTKLPLEWCQTVARLQFEQYLAFTWGNSECVWNTINRSEDDHLHEYISVVILKKLLLQCTEKEKKKIVNIAIQILEQSRQDLITLSCISVFYKYKNTDLTHNIFKLKTNGGVTFVDLHSRVYQNWDEYMSNNKLPDCVYCYPVDGEYNKNKGFQVGFIESPAASTVSKALRVTDTVGKVVSVGAVTALGAVALAPGIAVLGTGAIVAGAVAGSYGLVRGAINIKDKIDHDQSVEAGDVLEVVGNVATVATAGAGTALKFCISTGREIMIAQKATSILGTIASSFLFLKSDKENIDLPFILNRITNASTAVMFHLGGKNSVEAFNNIVQGLTLSSDDVNNVLNTFINNNSIEVVTEESGGTYDTEEYVSNKIRSLLLYLGKINEVEESELMGKCQSLIKVTNPSSGKDVICKEICSLSNQLDKELSVFETLIKTLIESLLNSEDFFCLKQAMSNASEQDKTQFFLVLRNYINIIKSKVEEANAAISHKGVELSGYYNTRFHLKNEVLADVIDAGFGKNGARKSSEIPLAENVTSILEKMLRRFCSVAGTTWNLQQFMQHLPKFWDFIYQAFEDELKNIKEELDNIEHLTCYNCRDFFKDVGPNESVGTNLLKKVLDKPYVISEDYLGSNESQGNTNGVVVPAWYNLSNNLYCYNLIEGMESEKIAKKIASMLNIPEDQFNIENDEENQVKVLLPKTNDLPRYFVHNSARTATHEMMTGVIYSDK